MRYSLINRILLLLAFASIVAFQSCNAQPASIPLNSPIYEQTIKATDGSTFDLSYGGWNKHGVPLFYRSNAYFYVYTNGQPISFNVREQFDVVVFGNNDGMGYTFAQWVPLSNNTQNVTLDSKYKYAYINVRLHGHENENIPEELIKDAISFSPSDLDKISHHDPKIDDIAIDLCHPSEEIKQYQIFADGKTDCSKNINAFIKSDYFKDKLINYRVKLILGDKNSKLPLLSTGQITITSMPMYDTHLTISLNSDVNFVRDDIQGLSLKEMEEGVESPSYNSLFLCGFDNVTLTTDRKTMPTINGGVDHILTTNDNTYYEGILSKSGKKYWSSFYHVGLKATACNNIIVNNVCIRDCVTECVSIYNCSSINMSHVVADRAIGDNGITLANAPEGFVHVNGCIARNCSDVGICIQGDSALVENCLVECCGNRKSPLDSDYGVNSSFNCGGAYGTEPRLGGYTSSRIIFRKCKALHCANYAWYTDTPGTIVENCTIHDIVTTWQTQWAELNMREFKYSTLGHRKSACAVVTSSASGVENALVFNNCKITNVPFLASSSTKDNAIVYNKCVIKSLYKCPYDNKAKSTLVSCKTDKTVMNLKNIQVRK